MADHAGNAGNAAAANAEPGSPQQQQGHDSAGSSRAGSTTSTATIPPPIPPFAEGRNIRKSQYAEAIANPLPELAVVAQPEPVSTLEQMECDDTASSTRAVVEPDDISDHRPSAIVYVGEKPTLWRKYRGPIIVALIVLVIVLVGTVVGVVVSNSKDRAAAASPSASATTSSSALTAGSSSTSSSASATASPVRFTVTSLVSVYQSSSASSESSTTSSVTVFPTPATSSPFMRTSSWQPSQVVPLSPVCTSLRHSSTLLETDQIFISQTPVPSQCADSSGFLTSVSFMGVNGNGGWKTAYCGSASSSKDCCACCYKNKDGCNSWAYMPSTGFAGTSCAMIVGWDTGDDKDSTCPSGHGATVYFSTDSDHSSDVGAPGPCGVLDN